MNYNTKYLQEQGKLKALKKLLAFKKLNLKHKLISLRNKLKSGGITKEEYKTQISKLRDEAKNLYDDVMMKYGHYAYQLDPAHTGQTVAKFLSFLS